MNIKAGLLNLVKDNHYVKDCTISKKINENLYLFILAKNTSISNEYYNNSKLFIVIDGNMSINNKMFSKGEYFITSQNSFIEIKALSNVMYLEYEIGEINMLESKEIFKLKDKIPFSEGSIINKDIFSSSNVKFALMSMDKDTELKEHSAPGDALVFALEGEAIIGYEGEEYTIKEGEMFKFDKMGKHYVKATSPYKMALLIMLEN